MPGRPSQDQEALIADIHDSLRGGQYHSQYTKPRRLTPLDRRLAKVLAVRRPRHATRIHDMASSNAITSLEMFAYLSDRFPVEVRASDYYDRVHAADVRRWRVVFDAQFRSVQYVGQRLMICARRPDPAASPVDAIIKPTLQGKLLPAALAALAERNDGPGAKLHGKNNRYRQISLFHPRCIHLARTDRRFTLERDDIFDPRPGRYDVVRVANTLSTEFMSETKLLEGVRAVSRTIVDGGLLVLARNADSGDGSACGTIFLRRRDRLVLMTDVSEGYQHREGVLQLAL